MLLLFLPHNVNAVIKGCESTALHFHTADVRFRKAETEHEGK